jgi:hypothetical protein
MRTPTRDAQRHALFQITTSKCDPNTVALVQALVLLADLLDDATAELRLLRHATEQLVNKK